MNVNLNISSSLSEHYDSIYMVIQTAVNVQAYQFVSQPLLRKIEQDIMTCLSILPVNTTIRTSVDATNSLEEPVLCIHIDSNELVRIRAQIAKDFGNLF